MKTRIIQTRFWDDEFILDLEPNAKLIFLFFITNSRIGLTGAFECPERTVSFLTGVEINQLKEIKKTLEDKFFFFNSWILAKNSIKYNNYSSNSKQKMAYMQEYQNLPEEIKKQLPRFEVDEYVADYKISKGKKVHRELAEKVLNRKLLEDEVVHHIDKDPSNNSLENLAVMPKSQHFLLHKEELLLEDTTYILLSEYSESTQNTKDKNKSIKTKNKKQNTGEGGVGETVAVLESNHMQDSEFKQTFDDFVKMRSEKKKPVTPTNRVAMLKKLDTYEITEAIAKLKQAIENGWQGFDFPVRQDNKSSPAQQNSPPTLYGKPLLVIN